ncbi:MAG: hypothetical protein R2853_03865 [Thermomicrobiales bacterium]
MKSRAVLMLAPIVALSLATTVAGKHAAMPEIDVRLQGYPTATVRLSDDAIRAPEEISAGPTVLIVENEEVEPGHAFVLRVPDEVSDAELASTLSSGTVAESTPDWFWTADFLGNADRATPEQPAVALVGMEPGRYVVGDPFRPVTEFAQFSVPAPALNAANLPEPDLAIELFEMDFSLPDHLPGGPQLWQVTNTGGMLHEIAIFPTPEGATPEQVQEAVSAELAAEFGGDPAASRAAIDALGGAWVGWSSDLVAGVGVLSPQATTLAQVNLEPGTYGAVCFIPEPNSGIPHLMMGMTAVFEVTEPANS